MHEDAEPELIRSVPLVTGCTSAEVAQVAATADDIDLGTGRMLATETLEDAPAIRGGTSRLYSPNAREVAPGRRILFWYACDAWDP